MSITSSNQNSNSNSSDGDNDDDIPLAVATVCLPEDDCQDIAELEMGGVLAESDVSNRSTTANASSSLIGDGDIPIAVATPRNATNTVHATRTQSNNNTTENNREECRTWKKNLLFCIFCAFTFLALPYFVYRVSGAAEGSTDDNMDTSSWENVTNTTEDEKDDPPRWPTAPLSAP